MKGAFVCFEGIEGGGKSTQAELLRGAVEGLGRRCLMLAYPDRSSDYGRIIYRYLSGEARLGTTELVLLFMADFAKDSQRIIDTVENGGVVVCSRYYYSTIAYQCASGFDYARARDLTVAVPLPRPSVVFYLDVPVELGYERKLKGKGMAGLDINERDMEYIGRVRSVYERLLREGLGTECVRLDAALPVEELHKAVMKRVNELL